LSSAAFATAALPITVAWGASASSASAVRDGARCSIGTAPVFSIPLEPQPASQATTQPARATVAHNGAATVANRRGFMIPSSPKAPPEPCCTAPARDEVFFGSRHARAMTQTAGHQFFQKVLPECNASQGSNCCEFPDLACRGSFGPAITPTLSYDGSGHQNRARKMAPSCSACGRFGASPPWLCRTNRRA
jgi:hypothetical protein